MKLVRLGWNRTPARTDMKGNGAWNVIHITTEKPRLEMEHKLGKIHIDQSQSFAEVGLKGMADFRADNTSYGQSVLAKGIARIVDNGNQFIEIQNGADMIAEQADYNAFGMFEQEFGYGVIPATPPKITVDPATKNYHYKPGRVHVSDTGKRVQISYTPGKFEYYTY
ncbi:MAG: DUF6470 family protein [Bacillota bacterium]|nr:DUF6470 family protein [Bacillota bacterium]